MKVCFVTKRLAFGSAMTKWSDVEQLQARGITHVINLRKNRNGKKVQQFVSLWLPFRDDKEPRPRWFYRRALKFYKRATRDRHAKMFIMCRVGICRSASLTYFLLRSDGKTELKARTLIRKARACAQISPAYRESGEKSMVT
jgi:protein-tyrosine phosphatase